MDLSQLPSDTPVAFVPENPKQSGRQTWHRFEAYTSSTSLGQARESGATSADFKAAAASGHMKVGEAAKVHRLSALKRVLGSSASTEKTPGKKNARIDDGIEADETEGAAGPMKAEVATPVGPTRLDFSGHAGSSGDHGERVLEALAALSSKTDALNTKIDALSINAATKNDIAMLKAEVVASTRIAIAEAVGLLETRVAVLDARPPRALIAHSPEIQRTMDHFLALSKDMDPNFKRVSFFGFKGIPSTARVGAIETFMKKFPKFPKYSADHEFRGKHGEQVMKNASFGVPQPRKCEELLQGSRGEEGHRRVPDCRRHRETRTLQGQPPAQLFDAECRGGDQRQDSQESIVTFDHKERSLSMDGAIVFQQTSNELGGTFSGSMAGPCLP